MSEDTTDILLRITNSSAYNNSKTVSGWVLWSSPGIVNAMAGREIIVNVNATPYVTPPQGWVDRGNLVLLRDAHQQLPDPTWRPEGAETFGIGSNRDVRTGWGRVTKFEGDAEKKPHANVDLIRPDLAVRLRTIENLRGFFYRWMDGDFGGTETNANSVIRLIDSKTGRQVVMWIYSAREEIRVGHRKFSMPSNVEKTWAEAITEGRQSRGLPRVVACALMGDYSTLTGKDVSLAVSLNRDIQNGAIIAEAIPGERLRILGDSLDALFNRNTEIARHAARCELERSGASLGFIPMVVGVMVSSQRAADTGIDTLVATRLHQNFDGVALTIEELTTPFASPKKLENK